jgi:hypothetical protein
MKTIAMSLALGFGLIQLSTPVIAAETKGTKGTTKKAHVHKKGKKHGKCECGMDEKECKCDHKKEAHTEGDGHTH